jgi:hypothetical protein
MKAAPGRLDYLARSTPGLLLMVTAWTVVIVALLGLLSGPVRDIFGLDVDLPQAERVGRIIMLYHSLAVPLVAAVTYLILDLVPTADELARSVRRAITPGYALTSVGALTFAYLGRNWLFHGIFLLGLSLVFYAGVLLAVGLWPWRHRTTDPSYSRLGSVSLERVAFFVVTVATLISALIGAGAGSFFGNGFEALLAEDVVREEHGLAELVVISHLHIMLALVDIAVLLLVARRFDLKGRLHKIAIPLVIAGTAVMAAGCWAVIPCEEIAHGIIYGGSSLVLLGALLITIAGIRCLMKRRVQKQGLTNPTAGQRLRALLGNPLQLGLFLQMIWLNAVMVFPGLYTAAKLEQFRAWPFEAERRLLVGHWHILATISAVMVVLLVADRLRVRGWMRQILGWGLLIGANLAFTFGVLYEYLPPGADRDWTLPPIYVGIGMSLIALGLFLGRRLLDLLSARGRWTLEEEAR